MEKVRICKASTGDFMCRGDEGRGTTITKQLLETTGIFAICETFCERQRQTRSDPKK